jgi:DeoR/GlpR family transcriptional regulator of sugar metabolism
MNRAERQQAICDLLNHGNSSVEEIAAKLKVSGMTVRRELQVLADQGKVIRTHGGATMAERVSFEFEFFQRVKENEAAKQSIGRAAAALVKPGQSVLLDSGTTTLAVAQHLRGVSRVRVITTSLPIASLLQYDAGIQVLLLGGYLQAGSPDLAGALTEANLESLRADLAFIGTDGIDPQGAAYNESPEMARMLGKMVGAARRAYVVGDSSKLGQTALWRFCKIQDLTGLITDSGADRSILASLAKIGAKVILATGAKPYS